MQDSSYLSVDFSFNAWDSRIRRFLGISSFWTDGIAGLYYFGGWRYFQPMKLLDRSYFQYDSVDFQSMKSHYASYLGFFIYFQPMRLQDSSYFGNNVIFNQWNCLTDPFFRMILFSINEIAKCIVFGGGRYFQPKKLQNLSYIWVDVIFNQRYCRIRCIFGLTLYLTNKIAGFVLIWGWRYFKPLRFQDSSYFRVDVIFNEWGFRNRIILVMT